MKEILQTAICAVAAVIIVGIICTTVYETGKATREEVRLQAIKIKDDLEWHKSAAETELSIMRMNERIRVADSIIKAN
jgi:hypothetical protein